MTGLAATAAVFVDIGAHTGETLAVARRSRWGFDAIHCFEPAAACGAALAEAAGDDPRVSLHPVALWNAEGTMSLHGAGAVGASLFDDKPVAHAGAPGGVEQIRTVDTAAYLDHVVPSAADLTVKINVEGAELEILEGLRALLKTSPQRRIRALLVHVDADKIPGHEKRATQVRRLLAELGGTTVEEACFFGNGLPVLRRELQQSRVRHDIREQFQVEPLIDEAGQEPTCAAVG